MPRGASLYLDAVRFTAAMLVLLGHASAQIISGGLLWQVRYLGDACVVVFFVLSGFVIAYVASSPVATARSYALARAGRILSVTMPAIALTFLLDGIGARLDPDVYQVALEEAKDPISLQLLAALSFLNESWFGHIRIGTNGAYWSMGFEVWYYVAFGFAWFAPPRWRTLATAATLLVAGPKVAALFPLWLMGAGCFHLCRRVHVSERVAAALWLGTMAFAAIFLARFGTKPFEGGAYNLPIASFWREYLIGLWFSVNAIGAWFASPLIERGLRPVARGIRWAAGLTFSLYLLHVPIMTLLRAASPWPATGWETRLLVTVGPVLVVALLAPLTEYRKDDWRRMLARLLAAPRRA